ncbi:MAG: sulfatase-like hydrolase/transferase, partial [Gammaproteobacteria bacterium]
MKSTGNEIKSRRFCSAILCWKLIAIAILFSSAPFAWWSDIVEEVDFMLWAEDWKRLIGYLAVVAISLFSVCLLPFLRSWLFRAPLSILFLTGFGVDQVILGISGHHLTLDMAATLVMELDMADRAFRTFSVEIIKASLLASFLAVAFLLPPCRRVILTAKAAIFPVGSVLLAMAFFQIAEGKTYAFPSPSSVPAQLLVSAFSLHNSNDVSRSPVDVKPVFQPEIKKIVVVVDEAVRGDYLGLNNTHYDNTPYLAKSSDFIANYGVATSVANCSHTSRYLMRIGLPKNKLPDLTLLSAHLPTIWQYANNAGFETVLIDARYKFGIFREHMTYEEAAQINQYISVLNHPYYERDPKVADKLLEVLKRDEPMLIYVNKYGAHQPYNDSFPPAISYDPTHLVKDLPLTQPRRD